MALHIASLAVAQQHDLLPRQGFSADFEKQTKFE
jgi:hypothetical protein